MKEPRIAKNESEWKDLYAQLHSSVVEDSTFTGTLYGSFHAPCLEGMGILLSISFNTVPNGRGRLIQVVMSRPGTGRHINKSEFSRFFQAMGYSQRPFFQEKFDIDTPITHFYWPYPNEDEESQHFLLHTLGLQKFQ